MSQYSFEQDPTPATLAEPGDGGIGKRGRTGIGSLDGGDGNIPPRPTDVEEPTPESRARRFAQVWMWQPPIGHIAEVRRHVLHYPKELPRFTLADCLVNERSTHQDGEERPAVFQQLDALVDIRKGVYHITDQLREVPEMIAALAFAVDQTPEQVMPMRVFGIVLDVGKFGMFNPNGPLKAIENDVYCAYRDLVEAINRETRLNERQNWLYQGFVATWRSRYKDKYGLWMPGGIS